MPSNPNYPISTSYPYNGNVYEIERMQNVQFKMAELKERSESIESRTGIRPMGFFEFDKKNPTERERLKNGPWISGFVGALLGFLFGGLASSEKPFTIFNRGSKVFGVAGAVVGFLTGFALREPESKRVMRALEHYENYLQTVETSAVQAPSVLSHMAPTQNHAAALLNARAVAAETGQTLSV